MRWWEFGEIVKATLDVIGLTEQRLRRWCRWAVCWCEQRRTWLNETGEAIWEYFDPQGVNRLKGRFGRIVLTSLEAVPLAESSLVGILRNNGVRVSAHTTGRWLSKMVTVGLLSEMNAGGERWLSLR